MRLKQYIVVFIVFFKTLFDYLYESLELSWILQEVIFFTCEYSAWILVCYVFIQTTKTEAIPKKQKYNDIMLFVSVISYYLINIIVLLLGLKYIDLTNDEDYNFNEFRYFVNGFDKNLMAWGALILTLIVGKILRLCQNIKLLGV